MWALKKSSEPLRGGGRGVFGGGLRGVWGATGQAAPHNPPADSHGVCGWPWGEGGRFAWSAASGAVRAEVRPARRRNGAALAVATVEHGFFVTSRSEVLNDKQAGRWRCLPPRQ